MMRYDGSKHLWLLLGILLAGLALRLVVWQWHMFYPLGGDEQEYLNQALILLREHRYTELRLMRPPLYGVFLAASILLVDSLVQNLRLVQVFISTATILPLYALTTEIARSQGIAPRRPALLAALLAALSYTLAAYATELLTETLFLAGLTTGLWLLLRARRTASRRLLVLAGITVGLLCLLRSVALPLLLLGTLWLLAGGVQRLPLAQLKQPRNWLAVGKQPVLFLLSGLLIIFPWTVRNTLTYQTVILIDTTGAENLWLDNDPAGREAVKAQLYALGDDRATRQHLATERGIAAITTDPHRFLRKAWQELLAFVALEYTDDMRERRAIWVPPAEVAARLLLGDALFLLVLLGGIAGLYRGIGSSPHWLLLLWILYITLTAMLFHVELRYRLPLYPVLLPYTALWLVALWHRVRQRRQTTAPPMRRWHSGMLWRLLHPSLLVAVLVLLHAPYPLLAWHLGWKHGHLARANAALAAHKPQDARSQAQAALQHDAESVLARGVLAQAALQQQDMPQAEAVLHEAIALLPAHPQPHLLLGDVLRVQGETVQAKHHFSYETATLQDVQTWSWQRFITPPPSRLDVGNGLDLGFIQGLHATQPDTHWRWSTDQARLQLALPAQRRVTLSLRLASGRPADAPLPTVTVTTSNGATAEFLVAVDWQVYTVPLTNLPGNQQTKTTVPLIVKLSSDTFTPRAYDRTSDDGRVLGVMVDQVEVSWE